MFTSRTKILSFRVTENRNESQLQVTLNINNFTCFTRKKIDVLNKIAEVFGEVWKEFRLICKNYLLCLHTLPFHPTWMAHEFEIAKNIMATSGTQTTKSNFDLLLKAGRPICYVSVYQNDSCLNPHWPWQPSSRLRILVKVIIVVYRRTRKWT